MSLALYRSGDYAAGSRSRPAFTTMSARWPPIYVLALIYAPIDVRLRAAPWGVATWGFIRRFCQRRFSARLPDDALMQFRPRRRRCPLAPDDTRHGRSSRLYDMFHERLLSSLCRGLDAEPRHSSIVIYIYLGEIILYRPHSALRRRWVVTARVAPYYSHAIAEFICRDSFGLPVAIINECRD